MVLQVGVKILIRNEEGKFLLGRRAQVYEGTNLRKWDCPGGRIEPGAGLIENLAREVKEETGMEIVGEPKLLAAQDILRLSGRHVVRLTYLGAAAGVPQVSEEHSEWRWFSLDEMRTFSGDELDLYLKELVDKGYIEDKLT